MNSLNHSETDNLRDVDLMIAYLQDDVSLEEVEQIESLMEQDALYRAAMEGLQYNLVSDRDPMLTKRRDQQLQKAMPAHLDAAREWFATQDGTSSKGNSWRDRMSGLPLWIIAGGVMVLLLLIFLPFQTSNSSIDVSKNLLPDGDVVLAEQFVRDCGNNNPGLGRGEPVSVFSAFVENYAIQNYQIAAQQFSQLSNDPSLNDNCRSLINFYRAKSLMALGNQEQALAGFEAVVQVTSTQPSVINASHWYAGNLALALSQNTVAQSHFETLINTSNKEHLPALLEKDYIQKAKTYLAQMNE